MNQYFFPIPVCLLNEVDKQNISYSGTIDKIFIADLTNEEIDMMEFSEFVLGVDQTGGYLDTFLDEKQTYQIEILTDRNQ